MPKLVQRSSAVKAAYLISNDSFQVAYLQKRVAKLQSILLELLVRKPDEVEAEVATTIAGLQNITDPASLDAKIRADYSEQFWLSEPDTEFKVRLANELVRFYSSRFSANYRNALIEGIANQDANYLPYLSNFILE